MQPFIIDTKRGHFDLQYDRKYKIPANYGVGLRWKDSEGHAFESRLQSGEIKNGKRVARLVESNMLGSIEATHCYSHVATWSLNNHDHTEDKTYSSAGYGPERDEIQSYLNGLRINAKRRLTKVEKDMSGELIGKVGDWTYRFNTEASAKAAGIKTFLARFGPGWLLVEDEFSGDDIKVLAET